MTEARAVLLASAIVLVTGALWGLYWLPVRALEHAGLAGAWGTLAITLAALLPLGLLAASRWDSIRRAHPLALASIALGGAAFTFYSVGLVYGRVTIIILLFYLTPVWSTLIGRYLMGWPTPPTRVLAMAVGIAGFAVMLSAKGQWPIPRTIGEWMGLVAGVLWSVASTGMRTRSVLGPIEAAFVFAAGATVSAAILAPMFEPLPAFAALAQPFQAGLIVLTTGSFWWALSIASLMWATVRLEPARVGILLMAEVLVGAASAALLAGERLLAMEVAGGVLVLTAGLLELWPARRAPVPRPHL